MPTSAHRRRQRRLGPARRPGAASEAPSGLLEDLARFSLRVQRGFLRRDARIADLERRLQDLERERRLRELERAPAPALRVVGGASNGSQAPRERI